MLHMKLWEADSAVQDWEAVPVAILPQTMDHTILSCGVLLRDSHPGLLTRMCIERLKVILCPCTPSHKIFSTTSETCQERHDTGRDLLYSLPDPVSLFQAPQELIHRLHKLQSLIRGSDFFMHLTCDKPTVRVFRVCLNSWFHI